MSEETPEIPDLNKKTQASSDASVPGGAAQMSSSVSPAVRPSMSSRAKKLVSTPGCKAAAFVGMMGMGFFLGIGLLGVTALEIDKSKPKKPGLAGLKSSFRVRRGFKKKLRYWSGKPGELFDLIRGSKGATAASGTGTGTKDAVGDGEEFDFDPNDIDLNINVDGAGAEDPSGDVAGGGGASFAGGGGGGFGGQDSPSSGAMSEIEDPGDKTDLKTGSQKRFEYEKKATADRYRLGTRKAPRRKMTRGASATARSAGKKSESRRSSLDFVRGDKGAAPVGPSPAAGADDAGGSGGSSPRGGGGGGGAAEPGADPKTIQSQILSLTLKMKRHKKKAAEEEKKAHAMMALGNHPAAYYHYDKSEKEKDKADEANDQITVLTSQLTEQLGGK